MRLLRKLVAALLAGALALSALAAPSLTVAAQSGCASAAAVEDCDCGSADAGADGGLCPQAALCHHACSATGPVATPIEGAVADRAPVGGATPLMSLVLPPETAPPRRSR
jgi:hypothetical protein